jgi:GH43 family beta-xylosidase
LNAEGGPGGEVALPRGLLSARRNTAIRTPANTIKSTFDSYQTSRNNTIPYPGHEHKRAEPWPRSP